MKKKVVDSKQSSFRSLSLVLLFVLALGFVIAFNHVAIVGGGDSIEVNEDISYGYNFTINTTVENISTVLFILPHNFTFTPDTNGTSSLNPVAFTNSSNNANVILNWTNSTSGIADNTTLRYIWFNATNNYPGDYYNFTVYMYNMTTAGFNANYTINVTVNDTTNPEVTINSPASWSNFSGIVEVNATITDDAGIDYVFLNITNGSLQIGSVVVMTNNDSNNWYYWLNSAGVGDGLYNLTIFANDTNNKINFTEVVLNGYSDNTKPVVTLISPANSGSVSTTTTGAANFTFNVTDYLDLASCSLYLNNVFYNKITTINKSGATMGMYNSSLAIGSYSWYVNCTDNAGNVGNSSVRTYSITNGSTTTTTSPGGGGSVGGGSGTNWRNTYILNDDDQAEFESENGFTRQLKSKYRIRIKLADENHYVGIVEMTETNAKFEVASDPQTLTLSIGESKMFDVTDDGYYDLHVALNSIGDLEADVTVKKVHEQIAVVEDESVGEDDGGDVSDTVEGGKSLPGVWIGIIVAVIVIAVGVGYLVYKKKLK